MIRRENFLFTAYHKLRRAARGFPAAYPLAPGRAVRYNGQESDKKACERTMPQTRTDNTELFERTPVPRAVLTMAIPSIISQLIVLIYNMADTFFIGRTNNPYMVAGASLILPVFNICLSLAGLAGVGGGALISRLLGRKQPEEARRVYSFCVYLCVAAAGAFSLCMLVFMRPLMGLIGAGPDTYDYASHYAFFVVVCGGIPTVLSNTLANLLRSVGESKRAGFGITMGGLINIALDPLFMFVLLPKGMEIVGAGAATCLSNCLACGYFIVVLARLGPDSVLRLCPPTRLPARESLASVFTVGLPSSITTLLFDLDYVVIDRLMAGYGDIALAAVGIVLKVERLPLNVGIGICQGMVPIIAYNFAAKNYPRMRATRAFALKLGLGCAAVSILLYELFAGPIMGVFINDPGTVALGTVFLRVRVLATPLMFLCFFHVNLFNGFGKGGYALFLGVTRWVALNIPMLFLLNWLIGREGIVLSQVTADAIMAALSFIVYRYYEKRNIA